MENEKIAAINEKENGRKLYTAKQLMSYLSVGRNSALKIGKDSGARVEIGGLVRYDVGLIDKYIEEHRA